MFEGNGRVLGKASGKLFFAAMLAAVAPVALAQEKTPAYVMTVIDDRAAGDQLISGDYDHAIELLTGHTAKHGSRFAASNNLCVAYTKTNQLSEAELACSAALRMSRGTYSSWYDVAGKWDLYAVALSNRGVIRAVSGDIERARQDFTSAMKFAGTLTAAAENLAALEAKTTGTLSARQ